MANYLFIDVETTGLGSSAAVIELACIPYVDGVELPHFHSMIRPHVGAKLDPKAFEITKIDINEIWEYPEAKDVLNELISWIDSHETIFHLAGHNVSFDRNCLFRLFCRNGEYGSFITRFNNNDICTLSKCRALFKGKRNKPVDFKLESICRYFEIETGVSHRAFQDISNTIKVFHELEKLTTKKEEQVNPELTYLEKRRKYMDMKYIQMNPEGDVFITKEALKDKQATKFILNFLYERHCSEM
jgi:DNA polymerase III epsilon subunit-like protein